MDTVELWDGYGGVRLRSEGEDIEFEEAVKEMGVYRGFQLTVT
jgi:hypothetical protein